MPIDPYRLLAFILALSAFLTHALYLLPHQFMVVFRQENWKKENLPAMPLRAGLLVLFLLDSYMLWAYAERLMQILAIPPANPEAIKATLSVGFMLFIHTMVFVFFSKYDLGGKD